jgi:hypothetical protein
MNALDTTRMADEAQRKAWRNMSPEQRVILAFQMSEQSRAIAKEGIRQRNPNWAPAEVESELLRLLYPQLGFHKKPKSR